jgi:acetylornithine/succinyldiaminopimelate/putrescine aminotransferase
MGDNNGGREANYHGTTVIAQMFRDIWPGLLDKMEKSDILKVVPVAINDIGDFREKLYRYNTGKYKTAGFMHEIVLMNYGAINLKKEYLREAYALCDETDTPTLVDEIQSCMWYSGLYLFKNTASIPILWSWERVFRAAKTGRPG